MAETRNYLETYRGVRAWVNRGFGDSARNSPTKVRFKKMHVTGPQNAIFKEWESKGYLRILPPRGPYEEHEIICEVLRYIDDKPPSKYRI